MATASANAIERISVVLISFAASGFLPMASKAPFPIRPMPIAGPKAPIPIASAVAMSFNPSKINTPLMLRLGSHHYKY